MKNWNLLNKVTSYGQKLLVICCTIAVFSLAWLQVFIVPIESANAATFDRSVILASLDSPGSKLVADLDDTTGEIKNKIKENFGAAKNKLENIGEENQTPLQRANEKTQRNIQQGNQKLYNASSAVRDTAKDLKQDVKGER